MFSLLSVLIFRWQEDYHKNFFALLSQLTVVGTVTDEFFNRRLDMIAGDRNQYMIVILDQVTTTHHQPATFIP